MPRVFLGNFDFEHELAGLVRPAAQAKAAGMADVWLAVAGPDDWIVSTPAWESAAFPDLLASRQELPRFVSDPVEIPSGPAYELVPWGWSAKARSLAEAHGWRISAPPLAVVREVNRRSFRFDLERTLGVDLPGAALVKNMDDLTAALPAADREGLGWVLKAEFGMSGRERWRGAGLEITVELANWAGKRFRRGETLVLEPWLDQIAEAGAQFEIPREGAIEFCGIALLITDAAGVYRGSRLTSDLRCPPEWQPAVESGLDIAQRLQALGYFGPLGIDAMRYRDPDGSEHVRPLQDLNARWTMGRLALGWRRLLQPGEAAVWRHLGPAASVGEAETPVIRWLRTGPSLGNDPLSRVLEISQE